MTDTPEVFIPLDAERNLEIKTTLEHLQAAIERKTERNRHLELFVKSIVNNPMPLNFNVLQYEQSEWARKNFPGSTGDHAFLGVVEEVGELAHALLKKHQGIRGTAEEHDAKAKDAIGDIVIFLADVCSRNGWSFQEIVDKTWREVKERDWTKNRETGKAA